MSPQERFAERMRALRARDSRWKREQLGEPLPPLAGAVAAMDGELVLWCMYEVAAERLDRELPGAWDKHARDVWMPLPSHRSAMTRRAGNAERLVRERAPGLMRRGSEAHAAAGRMSHTERERVLEMAGRSHDVDEIVDAARKLR